MNKKLDFRGAQLMWELNLMKKGFLAKEAAIEGVPYNNSLSLLKE